MTACWHWQFCWHCLWLSIFDYLAHASSSLVIFKHFWVLKEKVQGTKLLFCQTPRGLSRFCILGHVVLVRGRLKKWQPQHDNRRVQFGVQPRKQRHFCQTSGFNMISGAVQMCRRQQNQPKYYWRCVNARQGKQTAFTHWRTGEQRRTGELPRRTFLFASSPIPRGTSTANFHGELANFHGELANFLACSNSIYMFSRVLIHFINILYL